MSRHFASFLGLAGRSRMIASTASAEVTQPHRIRRKPFRRAAPSSRREISLLARGCAAAAALGQVGGVGRGGGGGGGGEGRGGATPRVTGRETARGRAVLPLHEVGSGPPPASPAPDRSITSVRFFLYCDFCRKSSQDNSNPIFAMEYVTAFRIIHSRSARFRTIATV